MARIESDQTEPRILLVEGRNDKHVVWQLCDLYPEMPDFFIADRGDINAIIDSIGPELLAPGRQALGIMADADDDLQSRWDEVLYQLRTNGVQPPTSPDPRGTIISDVQPRVGVWLMPDNSLTGEIEEFIQKMIPDNDPVWPLAQRYINDIPDLHRKFPRGKTLRAQIHAWLSARQEPRLMGSAVRTKDLDASGALCQSFLDWLSRLFR